jgi:hypothetical protein
MNASHENPGAGQGAVLLDIGDDVGAVVVTMPADMLGAEVEIRPVGTAPSGHSHDLHVAVVNRPAGGQLIPSLVFPELQEGRYELHEKGARTARLTLDVRGGAVTTATWAT